MKKISTLFFILLAIVANVSADVTLPKKVTVRRPEVLQKNLISVDETEEFLRDRSWGQNKQSSRAWIVFSDRSENVTYTAPDGRTKYAELEFNEKLYIAQISGDYALVYNEPLVKEFPNTSKSAKSRGWVPMKNLLLWASCPTDQAGIYRKALIAQNMNSGKLSDLAFAYMNPTLKEKGLAKELKASMDFFFIMKEENGLSLLATNYTMGGERYMVLYGWVSKGHYVAWNQRSCLEPNWNATDAEYFKANNVQAKAYESKNTRSRVVAYNAYASRKISTNEKDMYRKPATHMRYPILKDDGDFYKCTTFAKIDGAAISEEELNKISTVPQIIDKNIDDNNMINFIVVIDGTKSMGEFYTPMKEAITEANKHFESSKQVKVGAVIYRDNADGNYLTEYRPMTRPDDPQLKKFLEYCGEYGPQKSPGDGAISSKNDGDLDEALYKGLNLALDMEKMKYSKTQTNIMFVIGDCGDHDALINNGATLSSQQKSLVEKMVNANVQLFSFQVRNLNEESFAKFVSQMNGMIKDNMIKQYGRIGIKSGSWARTSGGIIWDSKDQKYNFYMGGSFQALNGQTMSGPLLKEHMIRSFGITSERIQRIINQWQKATAIYGDTISDGATVDMAFYEQTLKPHEIEALKLRGSVIARNGYAPKKDEGDRPYWKMVLYISKPELQKLLSNFKKVSLLGEDILGNRGVFLDAIQELAHTYLGEERTEQITLDEVMRKMTGTIYDESSVSKQHSLKELGDKDIVSDEEFMSIVDNFVNKYENLQRSILENNNYVGRRNPGGDAEPYFWIPAEDMP